MKKSKLLKDRMFTYSLGDLTIKLRNLPVHAESESNDSQQAAVSLIVVETESGLQLLLIQKAQRKGDLWSGQMAFPGGHKEPQDKTLLDTAIRETQEEVGIELHHDTCVAQLTRCAPLKRRLPLLVTPYVFASSLIPSITMNHEVSDYIWVSLDVLTNHDYLHFQKVQFDQGVVEVPGFLLPSGQFIWGLTFRIIRSFIEIVERDTFSTNDKIQ
ncbi:MAG: CoA pyrophosphatase [Gammaproteobacteria bacterium]|nr:CoA pyrophosphatase [Gammaproteobacteria bacterium]